MKIGEKERPLLICPKCGSKKCEEVAESGNWWNHCWDCDHDWDIEEKK